MDLRTLTLWLMGAAVVILGGCASQPPPAAPPPAVVYHVPYTPGAAYPPAPPSRQPQSIGYAPAGPDSAELDHAPDDGQISDTDPSALEDFRADLEPYGYWVEDPYYGTVWVPYERAVGTRFVPYLSAGRWALTRDDQWIWVSNYPFGPIVFHYGRWVNTHHHGWVWVAGRRYSHAWVTFRVSDEPYIGWAPMPPRYVWRSGRAVMLMEVPPAVFVFVPYRYAFFTSVHSYAITHPWYVRHWLMHSWVYWPPGAIIGYYYCPPLHYVPRHARPSGRREPHPHAMRRVRHRDSEQPPAARASVSGGARTAPSTASSSVGAKKAQPQLPQRLQPRKPASDRSRQGERRPDIARPAGEKPAQLAPAALTPRPSRAGDDGAFRTLDGKRDAARSQRGQVQSDPDKPPRMDEPRGTEAPARRIDRASGGTRKEPARTTSRSAKPRNKAQRVAPQAPTPRSVELAPARSKQAPRASEEPPADDSARKAEEAPSERAESRRSSKSRSRRTKKQADSRKAKRSRKTKSKSSSKSKHREIREKASISKKKKR